MEMNDSRIPRRLAIASLAVLALLAASPLALAQRSVITIASATSPEQSGLFKALLPAFRKATGIDVRVLAVGTEQALDMGRRGDVDVVFAANREAEEKFVAEGFGVKRFEVMYNDFVFVGPKFDPAKAAGTDMAEALKKVFLARALFISRADKGGTHAAELRLWKEAGVDVGKSKDIWYQELGSGMGPTLDRAVAMSAYTLTDRGAWIARQGRGNLAVLVDGDKRLSNQYAAILVNPARHSIVQKKAGQRFIDWITSPAGQAAIAAYKIDGEQLFFPNFKRAR